MSGPSLAGCGGLVMGVGPLTWGFVVWGTVRVRFCRGDISLDAL